MRQSHARENITFKTCVAILHALNKPMWTTHFILASTRSSRGDPPGSGPHFPCTASARTRFFFGGPWERENPLRFDIVFHRLAKYLHRIPLKTLPVPCGRNVPGNFRLFPDGFASRAQSIKETHKNMIRFPCIFSCGACAPESNHKMLLLSPYRSLYLPLAFP